jgi:hypothetical protein
MVVSEQTGVDLVVIGDSTGINFMGHFPKYYRFLLNHPVYSTQYEGWNTGQ